MKKSLLPLLALFLAANLQAQSSWYVSPTGTNSPGNGSLANPFKTVTYASGFLAPGDTLFVRGGIYTNLNFGNGYYWKQEQAAKINNLNGASGNFIVIMPYGNEKPVFKCDGDFVFQIRNSSYIKVQGLEIYGETENIPLSLALQYQFAFRRTTNTGSNTTHENRCPVGTTTFQSGLEDISGLNIFRPYYFFTHGFVIQSSHHIDIVNNLIHHLPGEGTRFVSSDYVNAIGNEIHNCSRRSSNGGHGMSCYTLNSIDNYDGIKILFARNKVYDNYCEMASWSELKTIFNPVIDEGKGMTIQRSVTANGWVHGRIKMENNIAYNNGLSGIHVNEGDRVDIINNTLYNNSRYGDGNNLGISVDGSDFKIYNNIVMTDLSWGGFTISATPASTGLLVSHNLINGGLDTDIDALDQNTLVGSPGFVNAAAFNFSLLASSPAINSGLALVAPAADYAGNPRDGQPDRGALEYFAVLPLNLISFAASPENRIIRLNWKISHATDLRSFEVERSADQLNWTRLGLVAYDNRTDYAFDDLWPLDNLNYYRLKLTDRDGSITYSAIIRLKRSSSGHLSAYPQPCRNELFVSGFTHPSQLSIKTINGTDMTRELNFSSAANPFRIDMTRLKAGAYILSDGRQSIIILKSEQ